MIHLPSISPYRPETAILGLGDAYYDPVEAADFPQTVLRFRNDRWAPAVGLGDLDDAAWIRHFGRFEPLPDNLGHPLALAVSATSSACTTPTSATAAASSSPSCATARAGCSISAPRARARRRTAGSATAA